MRKDFSFFPKLLYNVNYINTRSYLTFDWQFVDLSMGKKK